MKNLKDKTLLLVDDEEDLLELMAEYFSLCFKEVHQASCMAEALEILPKEKVDLIISDLNMPDGTGFDLFNKVKEELAVPFIIVSGDLTEEIIEAFKNKGVYEVFHKPYNFAQIKDVLAGLFKE